MQKYAIKFFVFQSVMPKNTFIYYLDYSAIIIKEYANATSPEPYLLDNILMYNFFRTRVEINPVVNLEISMYELITAQFTKLYRARRNIRLPSHTFTSSDNIMLYSKNICIIMISNTIFRM